MPERSGAPPARRFWWFIVAAVVGADQLTKAAAQHWLAHLGAVRIDPYFELRLAYNSGAAFSFLSGAGGWQRWVFSALAIGVGTYLVLWLRRLGSGPRLLVWSLALILGGALGNLIDRLRTGLVVDFVVLHYQHWYWPAFNLADSAITVGAVLFLWHALREGDG